MDNNLDGRESEFEIAKESDMVTFVASHPMMAKTQLRQQDLQPQRYFFYKRITDNEILVFTEAEAANMEKSSHGKIIQQIGCSDGTTYQKFIKDSGLRNGQRIPKKQAQEILKGALDAEMKAATGNFAKPIDQNVMFDNSFPLSQRSSFRPPA